MNTTPVVDKSKPAPPQSRVFIADSLGRLTPTVFEQFRTHRAEREYREEGAGFDEGLDLARANSIFNAARA